MELKGQLIEGYEEIIELMVKAAEKQKEPFIIPDYNGKLLNMEVITATNTNKK